MIFSESFSSVIREYDLLMLQVFKGANTFEYGIEVTRGTVTVHHHLNTVQINDIILRDLYQQVVRTDSTKRIRGVKTFQNGIAAERLNVYGKNMN